MILAFKATGKGHQPPWEDWYVREHALPSQHDYDEEEEDIDEEDEAEDNVEEEYVEEEDDHEDDEEDK